MLRATKWRAREQAGQQQWLWLSRLQRKSVITFVLAALVTSLALIWRTDFVGAPVESVLRSHAVRHEDNSSVAVALLPTIVTNSFDTILSRNGPPPSSTHVPLVNDAVKTDVEQIVDKLLLRPPHQCASSSCVVCDVGGDWTPLWLSALARHFPRRDNPQSLEIITLLALTSVPKLELSSQRRSSASREFCSWLDATVHTSIKSTYSCQDSDNPGKAEGLARSLVTVFAGSTKTEILQLQSNVLARSNGTLAATGICDVVSISRVSEPTDGSLELARVKALLADGAFIVTPGRSLSPSLAVGVDRAAAIGLWHHVSNATSASALRVFTFSRQPKMPRELEGAFARLHRVNLSAFDRVGNALSENAGPKRGVEGHSFNLLLERKLYVALAAMPSIQRICEIGFNAGHSAALWLWVNPHAEVHMFDLWSHRYSQANYDLLLKRGSELGLRDVAGRLHIHKGNSLDTVPAFAAAMNCAAKESGCCDLISVDGGHQYAVAKQDLMNVVALANPHFHVGVMDDTNTDLMGMKGVDDALLEMEAERRVVVRLRLGERYLKGKHYRGVTAFQFTNVSSRLLEK